MTLGQFLRARGVRQGCPASGFLFAMAFDPIFRWLQDAIIPRNPAGLDFLQQAKCAHADHLAVAALSFRDLMTALAPAFETVDQRVGLNLNHRKCCWVQCGSERCESPFNWLTDDWEDFREMQVVLVANYVGTMIGPDGHIHRWTARRKNHRAAFFLRWPSTRSSGGPKKQLSQETLITWTSYSLPNVLMPATSLWLPHLLGASWPRWHQHVTPWIMLLASI